MAPRAMALLGVLLLLAGSGLAADPGARSPITTAGTVNDVVLAAAEGTLGIATQDPGGRFSIPPNPSAPVWYLYSADGRNLLQDGDADIDACDSGTAPFDDCQTHATHAAISQDGTRMVVASTADDGNPVLTFIRDTSGNLAAVRGMEGTVADLAMSDDGQTVAVISNTGTTSQTGHVYLYNWAAGGNTAPNQLWADELAGGAVGDLAISPDGQSLAVTQGSDHHRYRRANANQVTDPNFSGNGVDAAIANGGAHLSLAGSSDGWFILYTDNTAAGSRELRIRDASVSLDAVAIRRDATAIAVANSAGTMWVYRIDPTLLRTELIGKAELGAAAREIAFSRDGLSVAVAYGNSVAQYAVEPASLHKLWSANLAASSGDVAIDETGSRVAAATGNQAIVYDARHKVDIAVGAIPEARPGQKVTVPVTYTNSGNRMEGATLTASGPNGWGTTLERTQLRLAPDTSVTVRVNVTVPATEAPGTKTLTLASAMGAAGSPTTTITYTVPSIDAWAVAADGPTSLAMQAGGSNSFLINITNKGNVAKAPPITVAASPQGWTAELNGHTATLAAGESRQATVKLTAPAGAAQLTQGRATVTIQGAPPLELVGTVGASFGVDLAGASSVQASPGNKTLVAVTVKNTGNAPDTIRVSHGNLPSGWTLAFRSDEAALGPGATVELHADLTVPAGATLASPVELSLTARSSGDATKTDGHRLLVSLPASAGSQSQSQSGDDGGGKGKDSPGAGLLLALAAVAVAAAARAGAKRR